MPIPILPAPVTHPTSIYRAVRLLKRDFTDLHFILHNADLSPLRIVDNRYSYRDSDEFLESAPKNITNFALIGETHEDTPTAARFGYKIDAKKGWIETSSWGNSERAARTNAQVKVVLDRSSKKSGLFFLRQWPNAIFFLFICVLVASAIGFTINWYNVILSGRSLVFTILVTFMVTFITYNRLTFKAMQNEFLLRDDIATESWIKRDGYKNPIELAKSVALLAIGAALTHYFSQKTP